MPEFYGRPISMMYWDPDGLKDLIFSIRSTNYGITIDDELWAALVHGMVSVGSQELFGSALQEVIPLYPDNSSKAMINRNEYLEYKSEFKKRSRIISRALIQAFKADAIETFDDIRDNIYEDLVSMSESDRFAKYRELNQIGVLPYLGADIVGEGYALEIAGFLVSHENQTYLQYGLFEDFDKASLLVDVGSLGTALGSKPARELGKAGFRGLVSQARKIPYPKLKIQFSPSLQFADSAGGRNFSIPQMQLSFSMGGGSSKYSGGLPDLTPGNGGRMLGEAVSHLLRFNGTPNEKANFFKGLTEQIKNKATDAWGASNAIGKDGSFIFIGEGYPARILVINPKGKIFTGDFLEALRIENGFDYFPIYEKLKKL